MLTRMQLKRQRRRIPPQLQQKTTANLAANAEVAEVAKAAVETTTAEKEATTVATKAGACTAEATATALYGAAAPEAKNPHNNNHIHTG